MSLSEKEKNIIRFYEGDVSGEDPFWGDPKAYLTINSMFFEGVENELARTDEHKKLNPHFLEDDARFLDVIKTLYESGYHAKSTEKRVLYRVERYQDYLRMKEKGTTCSFTSTSTSGFLSAYSDKRGLALLVFELEEGVPSIDMAKALDHYAKEEESEVLLLPFTALEIEECEMDPSLSSITDMDGNPARVYARIRVKGIAQPDDEPVPEKPFERGEAAKFYPFLNAHHKPTLESYEQYLKWKEHFRAMIFHAISEIQKENR